MGTTVTYNGIELFNVQTRQWEQEVRYDDSGTDAIFNVFRLRFEGLLHAGYSNDSVTAVSAGGAAGNMVTQYAAVRQALLKPRGSLVVEVSNAGSPPHTIFTCEPCPGDASYAGTWSPSTSASLERDVDNGPKPKSFQVLQVIGAQCLRVAFEIECSKLVCSQAYGYNGTPVSAMPIVLSNRWSIEEAMDENQFMIRTISGRMRLSTSVAAIETAGLVDSAAAQKSLVVPGLEHGFRRASINYSVDPTGQTCEYRVVDRQVHSAAPWPATRMNVDYRQSTREGLNMTTEVYVDLEGPPYASKKLLFGRALEIIDAKLHFAEMLKPTGDGPASKYNTTHIVEQISFTDHIGDANRIEATARFLVTPGEQSLKEFFEESRNELIKPLTLTNYSPQVSSPPAIYGYNPPAAGQATGTNRSPAAFLVLQCYLQQPCLDQHGIPKWPSSAASLSYTDDQTSDSETKDGTAIQEDPWQSLYYDQDTKWSYSANHSVYTFQSICNRYTTDGLRVQLPVTRVTPVRVASQQQSSVQTEMASRADISKPSSSQNYDTCRVFTLGGGQARRTIDVDVERAGALPELPAPLDSYTDGDGNSIKATLLRHWIDMHPPTLTADGVTPIYRLTAHYVYALSRPPRIGESVRMGVAPQTAFARNDNEVKFLPTEVYRNPELDP